MAKNKKPIGAIVLFSVGVLFCTYSLIGSICHQDRPVSIILMAILLVIFAVQLYLTLKGARIEDDQNTER